MVTVLTDGVVVLRALTLDHVDEWMAGEDREQIRWFEFPGSAPRDNVVAAIRDWLDSWRTGGPVRHWGICDSEGRILGGVELRDLDDGEVNLSYLVFPAWRDRGIATRACRLALTYAVDEMSCRTAVIEVLAGNDSSLAVARKLGATATGEQTSASGNRTIVLHLDLSPEPNCA